MGKHDWVWTKIDGKTWTAKRRHYAAVLQLEAIDRGPMWLWQTLSPPPVTDMKLLTHEPEAR
jgi:hypothetical protein